MPLYNSQAATNSQLQSVFPSSPIPAIVFNAETPANGQKSLAVAIHPRPDGGPRTVSVQLECPAGIGAGVFQIQDSDVDTDGDYDSLAFGGANPGQIVAANLNASGVGRVELQVQAKFLRILCVTAPGNPVTVRIS